MRSARSLAGAVALAVSATMLLAACRTDPEDGAGPSTDAPPSSESPTSQPDDDGPSGGTEDPTTEDPSTEEPSDESGDPDEPSGTRDPLPTDEPTDDDSPQDPPRTEPPSNQEPTPEDPSIDGPTEEDDGGGSSGSVEDEEITGPDNPVGFGSTYQWDNGLAVTVSAPRGLGSAEPSGFTTTNTSTSPSPTDEDGTEDTDGTGDPDGTEDGSGEGQSDAPDRVPDSGESTTPPPSSDAPDSEVVVFDVTIINGTSEDFNASVLVSMYSGSSNAADEYIDPEAGLTGAPDSTLPPGEETTFSVAYEVDEPGDLTLEVWPEYWYWPAYFVGSYHA